MKWKNQIKKKKKNTQPPIVRVQDALKKEKIFILGESHFYFYYSANFILCVACIFSSGLVNFYAWNGKTTKKNRKQKTENNKVIVILGRLWLNYHPTTSNKLTVNSHQ